MESFTKSKWKYLNFINKRIYDRISTDWKQSIAMCVVEIVLTVSNVLSAKNSFHKIYHTYYNGETEHEMTLFTVARMDGKPLYYEQNF